MIKKVIKENQFVQIFKGVFSGVLGGMSAMTVLVLYSLALCLPGYYILEKYNKPNTKILRELQGEQYVGLVLCFIGLLPWLQYFFFGLLASAGGSVADEMF